MSREVEASRKRKRNKRSRSRSRSRRRRGRKHLPPDAWAVWPPPTGVAGVAVGQAAPWGHPAAYSQWPALAPPAVPASSTSTSQPAQNQTPAPASSSTPPAAAPEQSTSVGSSSAPCSSHEFSHKPNGNGAGAAIAQCVVRETRDACASKSILPVQVEHIEDSGTSDSDGDLSDSDVFARLATATALLTPVPEHELEPLVREWAGSARTVWLRPQALLLPSAQRLPKSNLRRTRSAAGSPASPATDEEPNAREDPLEPNVFPASFDAQPTISLPLWRHQCKWVEAPAPLLLDEELRWDRGKRTSTEYERRIRARKRSAAADNRASVSLDESLGADPAPPSPKGPTEAIFDAVNVANSSAGGIPAKNVRLVGWARPLLLELPAGTERDPLQYRGTEKAARQRRRQLRTPMTSHVPATVVPESRACPSLTVASAPRLALPAAPPVPLVPVPHSKAQAPYVKAPAVCPPQASPMPSALPSTVSYNDGLAATIQALQADTVPPDVAVRSLWARLSDTDRQRFGAEFPHFLHYVC
eukprot:TRINITY_DN17093_c0_g2_i1.p1 TRINITY_DN17093_c0_g2~~TRINITY_DN17093_c0_g2_i1.p1  ORF type:complete len:544 (+),score=37.46 TRINITY_DN17093_c0_g2_i1:44-1633(+)